MKITSINAENTQKFEIYSNYLTKKGKVENHQSIVNKAVDTDKSNESYWQALFLDKALDQMVNNLQNDNSHPLSKKENEPINTYLEALGELNKINAEAIKGQGLAAHSFIDSKNYLDIIAD